MSATGRLNHRVQFQRRTSTKSAAQQLVTTWPAAFTRWAERQSVTGNERWLQGQQLADVDTVLVIRSDSQTRTLRAEEYRAVDLGDNAVIEIKGVLDRDGGRTWLHVLGTHRVS